MSFLSLFFITYFLFLLMQLYHLILCCRKQWRSQLFFHGGAVGWQPKMMGWLPLAIKARFGIASRTHDN
jgi:hypothetical protein